MIAKEPGSIRHFQQLQPFLIQLMQRPLGSVDPVEYPEGYLGHRVNLPSFS
jgi:hypothetical protein